jgi:polysaccharide biosynthesis protein PslG
LRRLRLHIKRVANSFRANMFGISAGGETQNESCAELRKDLTADLRAHARWLRVDINWAVIQNSGPSRYDWSRFDRVVKLAMERGMHVLGVISYTPRWARPKRTLATYGPSPVAYAGFARAAAHHGARLGIHDYEIWNEPNTSAFWQPAPDTAAYTAVLKAAYVAIKEVEPSATVLTGGTAPAITTPGSYSPVDFLKGIYASGGRGYFDAVGHHPYCWPVFPGAKDSQSAWYQMYGTNPSLRGVMISSGDRAKKIWATEFGAPTDGPAGTHVTPAEQARMVLRAYKLFAGYGWGGPLFFYEGRDFGTNKATNQDFFGLRKHDFSRKPAYGAYLSASRAVSRRSKRR